MITKFLRQPLNGKTLFQVTFLLMFSIDCYATDDIKELNKYKTVQAVKDCQLLLTHINRWQEGEKNNPNPLRILDYVRNTKNSDLLTQYPGFALGVGHQIVSSRTAELGGKSCIFGLEEDSSEKIESTMLDISHILKKSEDFERSDIATQTSIEQSNALTQTNLSMNDYDNQTDRINKLLKEKEELYLSVNNLKQEQNSFLNRYQIKGLLCGAVITGAVCGLYYKFSK